MSALQDQFYVGDEVGLLVERGGAELELTQKLLPTRFLVPRGLHDQHASAMGGRDSKALVARGPADPRFADPRFSKAPAIFLTMILNMRRISCVRSSGQLRKIKSSHT